MEDTLQAAPDNHEVRLVLAQHLVAVGWYEAAQPHIAKLESEPAYAELAHALAESIPSASSPAPLVEASAPEPIADELPTGPADPVAWMAQASALHADVVAFAQRLAVLKELGAIAEDDADLVSAEAWSSACMTGEAAAVPVSISLTEVADAAQRDATSGLELAIAYLEQTVKAEAPAVRNTDNADLRRELLVQVALLEEACGHADLARDALIHLEHEVLGKRYRNAVEIFSLDDLCDIPRDRFFVCEDNAAYDMAQLVQWLASQGSTWTHPDTLTPLSLEDTRNVLRHPLGTALGIKRAANERMVHNISKATLERLQTLAQAMLDDDSLDFKPSHLAVDSFRQYLQRLPVAEKDAISTIRVSTVDSHTYQVMQGTPQQFIRDFEANDICGHKAGQFLRDAAKTLMGQL